jgi:hemoglobin-like flavoprotein
MMTPQQIALVKKTWRIYSKIDPLLVGDVFYEKLFSEHPALRRLFKTPMAAQSNKLVDMLTTIVTRLDSKETLFDDLRHLALRHVQYGTKPEHYRYVGEALMWTLQQGLGADWTPEVQEAWEVCYKEIAEQMLAATVK